MSTETIERTFTVSGPARLKVENIAGHVNIRPGQDGVIQVTATKHTGKGDAEKTHIEIEQAADGSVHVATKYNSIGWSRRSRPCKVDYEIEVPAQCSLKASNVSSSLDAQGLEGDFKLRSVSGTLNLRDLRGELDFASVSGKIEAHGLHGNLTAENVSGKIRIEASEIPSIKGKSVSGNFRLETPLGAGPYTFNSVSGSVTLVVPGDTRASISQNGISGSVRTNLPVTTHRRSRGSEYVEVQDGGTAITLNSVSGQVRLISPDAPEPEEAAEAVRQAAAPQAIPPKPAGLSQMQILEAIERGELSVEEALDKMNA